VGDVAGTGALLRDRMRDLVRNNPHAAKAVSVLVNNIIGAGIIPRAATGSARLDDKVNALWEAWSAQCDADGRMDIYGLQTLAIREMVEAGEVLVRRRPRLASDGLAVPVQLQVIEADLLDSTRNGDLTDGGRVLQGVEFDPIGRRRAYWLYAQHPGEAVASLRRRFDSVAVPARDVVHLYERQRTQVRGVPWGAPVMRVLRDLDDWTVSELKRKQIESCVVGVVLGADEPDQGIAPSVVDADGKRIEQFEPGLIVYARGGNDIKFNQPAATAGTGEWLRAQLHIVAAGFRMPYELLTGDLSQVNYSSIRAGLVEFRRLVDAIQWQIVIPLLCQPIWAWFYEAA
jgi:lambda family phage portal protein